MRWWGVLAAVLAASCAPVAVSPGQSAPGPTYAEILDHSPASDWRPLDPEDTLYMELPTGRVIIELAPDFAPEHIANIRALARAHYWDNAAILRAQDNYVVQWGRPDGDTHDQGAARAEITTPEYDRRAGNLPFTRMQDPDSYAAQTGFTNGFPAARDGRGETWMLHCYGIIGVARDNPPNTGSGTELYVVIGQAPRHLDRNLALVGRVVQGMDVLGAMKRGTGALGFYQTAAERTPIRTLRVASDVPAGERTNLEELRTDSATFRAIVESRRFRREQFFVNPTGHINACNVAVPTRAPR